MPPKTLSHDVKTRIDVALHRRLKQVAKEEDRSESAIVRRALRLYFDTSDALQEIEQLQKTGSAKTGTVKP